MDKSKETPPLVTVIIPTYQRPTHLKKAIESVFQQTYRPLELIVVDDNGFGTEFQKKTEKIIATTTQAEYVIKYLPLRRNGGACKARNAGIDLVEGEFIAFLDDDDEWCHEKIFLQVEIAKKTGTDLVYGGFCFINKEGDVDGNYIPAKLLSPLSDLFSGNVIGTTSVVLVRGENLKNVGGFDESLASCQDWDLWIRLAQAGSSFARVDKVITRYHCSLSDRISTDSAKQISGHCAMYFKYREMICKQPPHVQAHHARYIANYLIKNGDPAQGRNCLLGSWRFQYWHPRFLLLMILSFFSRKSCAAIYKIIQKTKAIV